MSFKEFLVSMVSDAEGGGISSKRIVGWIAFIVYIALIFINTYTNFKTPNVFVDGLMYIVLGVFLASTLEYFSKRQTSTSVKVGDDSNVTVNNPPATPTKPVTPTPAPKPVPKTVVSPKEPVWIVPTDEADHVEVIVTDKNINE